MEPNGQTRLGARGKRASERGKMPQNMIRRYDRIVSFNDTTPDKGLDVPDDSKMALNSLSRAFKDL